MKLTLSPQDQEIIQLLKRLGTLSVEYPEDLLAVRRATFAAQIEERNAKLANGSEQEEVFSQEQVIALLEGLKPVVMEYPRELLSARRAAFIAQIGKHHNGDKKDVASSQDRVVGLLEKLKAAQAEYPPELLAARRAAFLTQIQQHNQESVREEAASEAQVIEILEGLKSVRARYPSHLHSARRAAFLAQIEQYTNGHERAEESSRDPLIRLLGRLKTSRAEYPPELLAARRAAFVAQVQQHNLEVEPTAEKLPSYDGSLAQLFDRLRSIRVDYPPSLWTARRSRFVAQIREGRVSVLEALKSAIFSLLHGQTERRSAPRFSGWRISTVFAILLVAAFVSSQVFSGGGPLMGAPNPLHPQEQAYQPDHTAAATSTGEVAQVICKPGYLPPLCLAQEADQSQDLTFPGNGSALPAVAKDTLPGYDMIHDAAYVNDGVYGPGASWISNSPYSWIKIDLGHVRTINTITFGRDRLGNLNDGDPGQFVIAVALFDDVYADGNSHNDFLEYKQVYDSEDAGFDGVISGPETVEAIFAPVEARFVKLTFENAGTAVDEIEAFMLQPYGFASNPTHRPRNTLVPPSFTPIPTNTLVPSRTPTLIPTNTLVPTRTATLVPTNTWVPTFTLVPTDTATPPPTRTPRPTSTDVPTDTPKPPPTDTPEPPTDTPEPPPTDTPEPPTDTPEPPPTETPETVLNTPEPLPLSTSTPEAVMP